MGGSVPGGATVIVVVVGVMRSGTSLVSRQLHRLGVPMGTTMRFPLPTSVCQEDWEDVEFTDLMLAYLTEKMGEKEVRDRIRAYGRKRGKSAVWGVKSPFLLPYVTLFKESVEDEVRVVQTRRSIPETFESIERQLIIPPAIEAVKELQRMLIPALDNVQPDLVIDIEESWASPETVKSKLQDLLRS